MIDFIFVICDSSTTLILMATNVTLVILKLKTAFCLIYTVTENIY